jgi:hypothetical protein
MQSRAIRLVEVVLLMREDQVDLAAFWQVDRLVKDEPATTNPGAERQRHASQDSIARHEALRSRAIAGVLMLSMCCPLCCPSRHPGA